MMEWETGKHMCNKHEMNMQVLIKIKIKLLKLGARLQGNHDSLGLVTTHSSRLPEHDILLLNSLSLHVETTWQ